MFKHLLLHIFISIIRITITQINTPKIFQHSAEILSKKVSEIVTIYANHT